MLLCDTCGETALTHGLQQWAADTTHCSWTRVPPQKWLLRNKSEAWYFILKGSTSVPPIILSLCATNGNKRPLTQNFRVWDLGSIKSALKKWLSLPFRFTTRRRSTEMWQNLGGFILFVAKRQNNTFHELKTWAYKQQQCTTLYNV